MERIPQSVAKRVVLKAYLASDHVSAATGKTIAVVLGKNGGAFANPSAGATNATEISNGWYYVDLSTTDTGTLGPLIVRGTSATIDDAEVVKVVENAFNAGFTGVPGVVAGASGGVPLLAADLTVLSNVHRWLTGTPNALQSGRVDSYLGAALDGVLTAAKFAAGAFDAVWTVAARILTAATNITSTGGTTVPQTGDAFARLGAPSGATVSADVAAVKVDTAAVLVDTNELHTDWTNGGRLDLIVDTIAQDTTTDIPALIAALQALVDDLESRLSAVRAGYLDNLSGGAVALQATATNIEADTQDIQSKIGTPAGASIAADLAVIDNFVDDLEGRITAARAGYLDNLSAGAAALQSTLVAMNNIAAGAAMTLTAAERTAIADAWTARNIAGGSSAGRTNGQAMATLRNKCVIAGGVLTVYDTDDTAVLFTAAVVTTAGDPLSSIDPAT